MSLPVALSLRSGKGVPSHTPAIPKIPGDVKFIAVKLSQNVVNLEIFHERNWYLTQLTEFFLKKWLPYMDLKEIYCNNYIVLIAKYRNGSGLWWKKTLKIFCRGGGGGGGIPRKILKLKHSFGAFWCIVINYKNGSRTHKKTGNQFKKTLKTLMPGSI